MPDIEFPFLYFFFMKYSEICRDIGSNIKEVRIIRGLSHFELASIIDCDRQYIGEIENGKTNITMETLDKIARALQVPVDYLTKGIGSYKGTADLSYTLGK
jgi:transcriptional regulator with XRE-family HTH domain